MRNAVGRAVAGGLLGAGTLGPLCGAAFGAPSPGPSPWGPPVLVLTAAPEAVCPAPRDRAPHESAPRGPVAVLDLRGPWALEVVRS